jgi:hypothetical protein
MTDIRHRTGNSVPRLADRRGAFRGTGRCSATETTGGLGIPAVVFEMPFACRKRTCPRLDCATPSRPPAQGPRAPGPQALNKQRVSGKGFRVLRTRDDGVADFLGFLPACKCVHYPANDQRRAVPRGLIPRRSSLEATAVLRPRARTACLAPEGLWRPLSWVAFASCGMSGWLGGLTTCD